MELLKIEVCSLYDKLWITGLCRTHLANHAGCRALKLVGWIKKAGYEASQSRGCVITDMPVERLETLIGKLEKKAIR